MDYPFANRLYPKSLNAVEHVKKRGPAVFLMDNDGMFQPRKVERSGLSETVNGDVLIYIHKEENLNHVEQLHPAEHYVLVDDKLRTLTARKRSGARA